MRARYALISVLVALTLGGCSDAPAPVAEPEPASEPRGFTSLRSFGDEVADAAVRAFRADEGNARNPGSKCWRDNKRAFTCIIGFETTFKGRCYFYDVAYEGEITAPGTYEFRGEEPLERPGIDAKGVPRGNAHFEPCSKD